MGPRGNPLLDLVTFRHGYDLHLVVSLGIGLPLIFQDPVRTKVPAYAVINSALSFLPFHPMRAVGGVLVALGIVAYIGCRRRLRLGFYGVLAQSLFWFAMTVGIWSAAFSHHAGFQGAFFCLALSMGATQYLKVYEVMLREQSNRTGGQRGESGHDGRSRPPSQHRD